VSELERKQAAIIEEQAQEIRLLKQKVDLLVRQIYGSKSEKLDPGQLELLLGKEPELEPKKGEAPTAPNLEEGGDEEGAGTKRKNKGPRPPRIPEHLPVVEQIIEPEPVKGCPEAWRRIGEEVSEQLDYEPGKFFRRRIVRPKYVRKADKDAPPITAKLPEKLLERGMAAPGLLAQIAISKFCDHLPLYRQEQIFERRYGVKSLLPTGSRRSTGRLRSECSKKVTSRWTKRPYATRRPAPASAPKATSGPTLCREAT
jgi:transposase